MKTIELLSDPQFKTGFHVLGINPTINHRKTYKHLDYNGEAYQTNWPIWQMAQWWTPYNLIDATFKKITDCYVYDTPSRRIEVNPKKGFLRLNLSGSKEYPQGVRTSGNQPWSHLLIEQDFDESVSLDTLQALNLKLNFNIEAVEDHNEGQFNPNLHAAQLLWYFVIHDKGIEGSAGYGNFKEFFWFGIPIYDNRYPFIEESMHVDQGGIGTTGRLIYSMSSRNYLKEPIQMGKDYTIEIDILPFVLKAKQYALDHGYLKKHDQSNYQIGYMNFGWELPGRFDVKSHIQGISALAVIK
ncbi:hypothetical protein [Paracholeplasma manati]|uniref:hypothetical protein n=1 Tax=Paracholeplasma manati TaxID=591373 RepID=UPI0024078AB2|nr:hypothetical protein [Paracholeplasma manati]MDG0888962.1 hypothetical protein [Paracholeplasma manati]